MPFLDTVTWLLDPLRNLWGSFLLSSRKMSGNRQLLVVPFPWSLQLEWASGSLGGWHQRMQHQSLGFPSLLHTRRSNHLFKQSTDHSPLMFLGRPKNWKGVPRYGMRNQERLECFMVVLASSMVGCVASTNQIMQTTQHTATVDITSNIESMSKRWWMQTCASFALVPLDQAGQMMPEHFTIAFSCARWIDSLPDRYFIIEDNAHSLSDSVLIPFSGARKHVPTNHTHDFHLNQFKMRCEMAFGLLPTKWQIFWCPVGIHLEHLSEICGAAARLHNFVIDNEGCFFPKDLRSTTDFEVWPMIINQPGVLQHNKGCLNTLLALVSKGIVVDDSRCKFIPGETVSHQLECPIGNLIRNQELDEQSETEEEMDGLWLTMQMDISIGNDWWLISNMNWTQWIELECIRVHPMNWTWMHSCARLQDIRNEHFSKKKKQLRGSHKRVSCLAWRKPLSLSSVLSSCCQTWTKMESSESTELLSLSSSPILGLGCTPVLIASSTQFRCFLNLRLTGPGVSFFLFLASLNNSMHLSSALSRALL